MKGLSILLFLSWLSAAIADNHSDTDTNSTGGLSGGAVAGIIIGVLAGLTAVGVGVWYFFLRGGAMTMGGAGAATTAGKLGDNHLPMMAMRVNGDDDL